jgi:hypothetical protein
VFQAEHVAATPTTKFKAVIVQEPRGTMKELQALRNSRAPHYSPQSPTELTQHYTQVDRGMVMVNGFGKDHPNEKRLVSAYVLHSHN